MTARIFPSQIKYTIDPRPGKNSTCTPCSGGSEVSRGGAPIPKGMRQPIILAIFFLENCMKLKKIGLREGVWAFLAPYTRISLCVVKSPFLDILSRLVPPTAQCNIWKIWQNRMLAPPRVGVPSYGESYIRPCTCSASQVFTNYFLLHKIFMLSSWLMSIFKQNRIFMILIFFFREMYNQKSKPRVWTRRR